ncbi:MAG: hypothetical protein HUU35_15760, partial [Armatimonadetes bacterium]|nr:hypothetical protein [Armatimonadota bacterium]
MRRFLILALIVALGTLPVRAQLTTATPSAVRLPALEAELAGPLGRQRLAELVREVRHLIDLEEALQADLQRQPAALSGAQTEELRTEATRRLAALTDLESDLAERQAVAEAAEELRQVELALDAENLPVSRLEELLASTLEVRKEIDARVNELRQRLEELAQQTALLGPVSAQETSEVSATRAALAARRRRLDQSLSL